MRTIGWAILSFLISSAVLAWMFGDALEYLSSEERKRILNLLSIIDLAVVISVIFITWN